MRVRDVFLLATMFDTFNDTGTALTIEQGARDIVAVTGHRQ